MDRQEKIARRAYAIWQSEGEPEGRAQENWHAAEELTAHEDKQMLATRPVDAGGDGVEPALAYENQGEFPTLTDQGEERSYPDPKLARGADPG
ncbi:hypothetical protein STVA_04860 [Allostella vacuolata]|nr:hypothetical protein STVA_04860 [Stella vacuolata]